MKYLDFYKESQRELTSTFISMFAKGRPAYADHLRWLFENEEKEKLVQKPVFQSVFPWRTYPSPMSSLNNLLGQDFIDALDKAQFQDPGIPNAPIETDTRFPRDRNPYQHQVESWEAVLRDHKSILVTTGTGSGKTECFMIPVLKELWDAKRQANGQNLGVQAIFLYPLNALIASQRKRIHSWCKALNPNVSYGIYTVDLDNTSNATQRQRYLPQIIDRETLRTNPPQILFTNPTMLEYMMVRKNDQTLVESSRDLKWIILDEAHTYEGSKATEMAMLIRRVLQLFGKTPAEVNFAITSATIGEGRDEEMNEFISQLTGKDARNDFRVIGGERIVPELTRYDGLNHINTTFGLHITENDIVQLRNQLNAPTVKSLSLDEICQSLGFEGTAEEKLKMIDMLSAKGSAQTNDERTALLPVRAHFFGRSISGLYACTNPDCSQYHKNHIDIGTLTSFASQTCPHCGGKMLEVVRCNSCGEFLLQGEREIPEGTPPISEYFMKDNTLQLHHLLDDDDTLNSVDEEDEDDGDNDGNTRNNNHRSNLLLSSTKDDVPFNGANLYYHRLNSVDGTIQNVVNPVDGAYTSCNNPNGRNSDDLLCPSCGESSRQCTRFVFPSSLESRLLTHIFLDQSEKMENVQNPNTLVYEGRKFITFTDNRQGTAKIAQGANVDVEREWVRSIILDEANVDVSSQETDLEGQIEQLESVIRKDPSLTSALTPSINTLRKSLITLRNTLPGYTTIETNHSGDTDLQLLTNQIEGAKTVDYLKAMFIDQMGNKPLRGNSLETLGLVHLDYPAIRRLTINQVPPVFNAFYGYVDDVQALNDWKDFLRICLDYQIRRNTHIIIPDGDIRNLVTQRYFSDPIYYIGTGRRIERGNGRKSKIWPLLADVGRTDNVVSRLPLLLLLGKGICEPANVDQNVRDSVNGILREAWDFLSREILTNVNEDLSDPQNPNNNYVGYKLNIFDDTKVKLSLIERATVCPMTSQILDCTFRGISPMAKGHLDPRTLAKYTIISPIVDVPRCSVRKADFVQNGEFNERLWRDTMTRWFDETFRPALQPLGGDLSQQRNLFLKRPIYLTKEHSAQIDSEILRDSERKFENGQLNVLSCSTTMEMGVDIGGISTVMMNNVPPKPANYLQRAGRAGRRSETQSLALTICNDNPIGHEVLDNLKWALDHEIEAPRMSLSSETIIQRHINSLLLGIYIRSTQGAQVSDQIGAFIYGHDYENTTQISYTFDGYKLFLRNARTDNNTIDKIRDVVRGTVYESYAVDDMISQAFDMIEEICGNLSREITNLQRTLQGTNNTRYQNYLNLRIKTLWEKHLISYLSEHNYIPSASIPTNNARLVYFIEGRQKETQRQRSQAIQEYAPGKEVVIANMVYPVIGIEIEGDVNADRTSERYLSKCTTCGYVSLSHNTQHQCPQCGGNLSPILEGQNPNENTLSIEPTGFVAGTGRRTKNPKIPNDFVVPELIGMEQWDDERNGEVYSMRSSKHADAQILYVNKGHGYGFAYCPYCGKMEAESGIGIQALPSAMNGHIHLLTGNRCIGNSTGATIRRNVILSACYHTDISEMEVQTDYDPYTRKQEHSTLLYTLGTIICNTFTKRLGINEDEVWFGITPKRTLFFYDTASGGAGYASQLPMYIEKILDECKTKLSSCQCQKACTSCLIDRRSQWFVQYLDKQIALEWLNNEYNNRQIIPVELKQALSTNDIRKVTKDIVTEILTFIQQKHFNNVDYFLKEGLQADDLFSKLEREFMLLNAQGKTVKMVVALNDSTQRLSMGVRMELNNLGARYSGLRALAHTPDGVTPVIQFADGNDVVTYVKYDNNIYCVMNTNAIVKCDYSVDLTPEPTDVCYVYNFSEQSVLSNELLGKLLEDRHLEEFLHEKSRRVSIKYSDIYISNPLSCMILASIVNQFRVNYGLEIMRVDVETGRQFKTYVDPRYQDYLDADFAISSERDDYLRDTFNAFDIKLCDISTDRKLPHARLLTIYNDEYEITINPDGGFAQGWRIYNVRTSDIAEDRTKALTLTNSQYRSNLPIRFTIGWKNR